MPPKAHLPFGLSEREMEVLGLMAKGYIDRHIAEELFISHKTVGNHVQNILAKLKVKNRTEAVAVAIAYGLLDPEKEGTEINGGVRARKEYQQWHWGRSLEKIIDFSHVLNGLSAYANWEDTAQRTFITYIYRLIVPTMRKLAAIAQSAREGDKIAALELLIKYEKIMRHYFYLFGEWPLRREFAQKVFKLRYVKGLETHHLDIALAGIDGLGYIHTKTGDRAIKNLIMNVEEFIPIHWPSTTQEEKEFSAIYHRMKGYSCQMEGDNEQAGEWFSESMEKSKDLSMGNGYLLDNPGIHFYANCDYAEHEFKKGQIERAITRITKALASNARFKQRTAGGVVWTMRMCRQNEEPELAEKHYDKLNKEHFDGHFEDHIYEYDDPWLTTNYKVERGFAEARKGEKENALSLLLDAWIIEEVSFGLVRTWRSQPARSPLASKARVLRKSLYLAM